jgi:hypothetical protein
MTPETVEVRGADNEVNGMYRKMSQPEVETVVQYNMVERK